MNRYSKWMVPWVLVAVFSTSVFAQSSSGRLNNRLDNRVTNQGGRTEQEERSGESARREGRRLESLGAELNNEVKTKVDGKVTPENRNRPSLPPKQIEKKIDTAARKSKAPAGFR